MSGRRVPGLVLEARWLIRAPRGQVFAALTEPAHLALWWGPAGFTVPHVEVDLTIGGGYRFAMQPPGGEPFALEGEFVDIRPPELLAYTFRWDPPDPDDRETTVRLSLDEVEGGTEVALSQGRFLTEARLALHQDGWRESMAKLDRLLAPEVG